MKLRYVLPLLLIFALSFAQDECPTCVDTKDYTAGKMITTVNEVNLSYDVSFYYEYFSKSDPRPPITDAPLIFLIKEIKGNTEKNIAVDYQFTDSKGRINYIFSKYAPTEDGTCIEIKTVYCPLICETDCTGCWEAFKLDMNPEDAKKLYSEVKANPQSAKQLPEKILPTSDSGVYCKPQEKDVAPVFCLPLGILFALLAGALYLSGRNPFGGFDFATPKVGKHFKYSARGRGAFFDTGSAVSSLQRIVGTSKSEAASLKSVTNATPLKDSKGNIILDKKTGKPIMEKTFGEYTKGTLKLMGERLTLGGYDSSTGKVSMIKVLKGVVGIGATKEERTQETSAAEQRMGVVRGGGAPLGLSLIGRITGIKETLSDTKEGTARTLVQREKLTTTGKILDFTFMILERSSLGFLFSRSSFLYDWLVKLPFTKDISATESRIASMRTEVLTSQGREKELSRKISEKEAEVKSLQDRSKSVPAKERPAIETALEKANKDLKPMKKERDQVIREIHNTLKDITTEHATLARLYADKALEDAVVSIPVKKLLDIDKKLEDLDSKISSLSKSKPETEKGKASVQQQIKDAESEIVSLRSQKQEILAAPNAVTAKMAYFAAKDLEAGKTAGVYTSQMKEKAETKISELEKKLEE
ncbi:hypothetical protein HZC08_00050, partial [Candidatus Micrarchaeota archaeon]|nr:hypothetical protein [Candidatus Micrarchaeota archaeon]